jgi:probable HAF family extracellular repeat protein
MVKYKISTSPSPAGFMWATPKAIKDAGQICGHAFYPDDWTLATVRPVVWPGGGAAQAIAVPGDVGAAYDINEAGDVVGYVGSYEPDHSAFLHRNGTTSMLTGLPGPWSIALSINNNGLIAGTCGPTLDSRVFVYDSNQDTLVETIEPLPGHVATSGGYINDDGDVVGISSNLNGQDHRLFIRRNGATEDLGAALLVAGINSSGMVVGSWQSGGAQLGGPSATSRPGRIPDSSNAASALKATASTRPGWSSASTGVRRSTPSPATAPAA